MGMSALSLRRLSVLLLLLGAGLAPVRPAAADEPLVHPVLREFYRTGKFVLYVSGDPQKDAQIYQSRRAGGFLVLGSDHGRPLLFLPRERVIQAIGETDYALRPDGGVDVLAEVKPETIGELRLDRGGMAVHVDGLVARLQPQPYLLGENTAEDVLLHSPEYERSAEAYTPRSSDVQRIKNSDRALQVVVFFGSWCPTCRRLLPRILAVDEAIAGSNIQIVYYGLPKGNGMRNDPNVRANRITHIPTGVIMVDGRSVGQIDSRDFSRPEAAILRALGTN